MTKNQSLPFTILVVILAGYGLWHWGSKGGLKGPSYPGSPVGANKALFFGDRLLAPDHLQDPRSLALELTNKLKLEIVFHSPSFTSTADMLTQAASSSLKEKPNIVFISTGAAALESREDLGTTVNHLKKIALEFQKNGAFVVHLGINPPGVGDNWAMGISHACREIPILCLEDIFAGYYTRERAQDLAMPPEAYQAAADKISSAVAPYLLLSAKP